MTDWVVVVNPGAGPRPMPAARVEEALARWGVSGAVEVSPRREDLARLVVEAARSGRRPAVVGGNGTVATAVGALVDGGCDTVLGVLPGTTSSDLMRTFALPTTIEAAAAHLRGGSEYRIDVAVATGEWGRRIVVNDVQAGLGAATAATAARLPRRLGDRRLAVGLGLRLPAFPRSEVRVEGERSFGGDALGVVLANGQFLGGGYNVAPRALLVDGELDVQVIGGDRRHLPALLARMRRGMHLASPSVRRRTMPAAVLSSATPWPVAADGGPVGSTPVRVEVLPAAVRVKI